jgi:hypothetical protein
MRLANCNTAPRSSIARLGGRRAGVDGGVSMTGGEVDTTPV